MAVTAADGVSGVAAVVAAAVVAVAAVVVAKAASAVASAVTVMVAWAVEAERDCSSSGGIGTEVLTPT